jgi:hypothetical protein
MIIRRKADALLLVEDFRHFANWDGSKHYMTLTDFENTGEITILHYSNGSFTFYRKNPLFWDAKEHAIHDIDSFLWKHRKALNTYLKTAKHLLNETGIS